MGKLDGIQIARALAALSVVYFHSKMLLAVFEENTAYPIDYLMRNGFYGVDLFFAISGFVLCVVVSKRTFGPTEFIIKRAFRIYPLWLATCFLYWWTISGFAHEDLDYVIRSFALLPTERFPILDSGWTLQHEIAFYALAALAVPLIGRLGLALFLVAATIFIHFAAMPWWAVYLANFYPTFVAGMVAYYLHEHVKRIGWQIPLALGCFAFWICTTLETPRVWLPLALALLVVGFANMTVSRPWRWLVLLGDASYSIYLVHSIVFSWIYQLSLNILVPSTWTEEFIRFGSIGLVCLVSVATWRYFETPLNRYGHRLAAQLRSKPPDRASKPAAGDVRKSS